MNEPTDMIPPSVSSLLTDPVVIRAREEYKKQLDIEDAIMKLPGFDYLAAWEILGALQARLVSRYENGLDEKVYDLMGKLYEALGKAEEQEPHKRWDEDRIDADKGRI